MPNIAVINLQNCIIETFYQDSQPNQRKFGGAWGWPDHTVHLLVPENLDIDIIKVVKNLEDSYEFVIDEDKRTAKITNQWYIIRHLRNEKLKECDWTQLNDVILTDQQKQEWMTYRQLLRDFPNSLTDEQVLNNNIVWPNKP